MTMRFRFGENATAPLSPVELTAIVCQRAWRAGGTDRAIVAQDFRLLAGDAAGTGHARDFDRLMQMLATGARRPLLPHGLGCRCVGGDERAFVALIATAARDHDDALLFAGLLMQGHAAWGAVLWHGGEAQASRDTVVSLAPADRAALIRFLESL